MRFFLIFLLILPFVFAQSHFFKEIYTTGETASLEIKINMDIIKDPQNSQLFLLNSAGQIIKTEITLLKIEKGHYLAFFDIPLNMPEGKYIFLIKNVAYDTNNIIKFTDISTGFDIKNQSYKKLRILPGAIVYRDGEQLFRKFRMSNLEDTAVAIMLPGNNFLTPSANTVNIPGKSIKTVYFLINQKSINEEGLEIYYFGNYVIPFYFIPSKCVQKWQCVDYGTCQEDNRKYCNKVQDINACGISYQGSYAEFGSISCTACVSKWDCSSWSSCVDGKQTRSCVDLNKCNKPCAGEECSEEKICMNCVQKWQCVDYGTCQEDNRKYCNKVQDINACGISYQGSYAEFGSISCTACVSKWDCSSWSSCVDGKQTRSCVDLNKCNKPCAGEECSEEKICVMASYNKSIQKYTSIIFFTDITKPDITVNSIINPSLNSKRDLTGALYIKNSGNSNITDIKFYLTGNLPEIVRANITRKRLLEPGSVLSQFIWVNEKKNPRYSEYRGELLFSSDQLNRSFPMIFVIAHDIVDGTSLGVDREYLFSEEVTSLPEEDLPLSEDKALEQPAKQISEKSIPYKIISSVLIGILVILIYFILRRSSKQKISLSEYLTKIERK